MQKTIEQYRAVIDQCRSLFEKKTVDYGTAWRILRISSLTDQIFIKAQRIRTIQETNLSKVEEGIESEFIGIINYCIIAQIQMQYADSDEMELAPEVVMKAYDEKVAEAIDLLEKKNHDYGEAWRDMRISSLTDLILMKILRVKQIEDNKGNTLVSEGIEANYMDMMNYAVFAMIKLNEQNN